MLAILSSSLASAIVGALIVGFYNLWAKRNEFVNDYYKSVVRRRIEAYEQLEQLIIAIKTTVLDTDKRPYHLVFAKDDDWESAHRLVLNVIAQALWLSEEAFEKTRDLSYLLFRLTPKAGGDRVRESQLHDDCGIARQDGADFGCRYD